MAFSSILKDTFIDGNPFSVPGSIRYFQDWGGVMGMLKFWRELLQYIESPTNVKNIGWFVGAGVGQLPFQLGIATLCWQMIGRTNFVRFERDMVPRLLRLADEIESEDLPLPPGSLQEELRRFKKRVNFKYAPVKRGVNLCLRYGRPWMAAHLAIVHDVLHMLTNFADNLQGHRDETQQAEALDLVSVEEDVALAGYNHASSLCPIGTSFALILPLALAKYQWMTGRPYQRFINAWLTGFSLGLGQPPIVHMAPELLLDSNMTLPEARRRLAIPETGFLLTEAQLARPMLSLLQDLTHNLRRRASSDAKRHRLSTR